MFLKGITFIWMFFIPYENIGMLIFVTCLNAVTGFGFAPQLSLIADAIDYQEEKTGVRSDGIAFAVYGLATKLGGAIGSSVGIMIITAFGYVAGQAVTASAQTGINFTANLFCGLLHLVAAAIPLLFWKMTDKDADDIRERLRVRNTSAE
jgi:Na+/melibiose symporter-like transporter